VNVGNWLSFGDAQVAYSLFFKAIVFYLLLLAFVHRELVVSLTIPTLHQTITQGEPGSSEATKSYTAQF
jgi:hypothetical protein